MILIDTFSIQGVRHMRGQLLGLVASTRERVCISGQFVQKIHTLGIMGSGVRPKDSLDLHKRV